MYEYQAPVRDMLFVLRELADLDEVARLPGYEAATADTVEAILEEAGRFASEVLAPLNRSGDREGAAWKDGVVRMPQGFKEGYSAFVANGWNGIASQPEYGGQGMPRAAVAAVREIWNSANMAFALCPALNVGAIEALSLCASAKLKDAFLPRMVSGEWTATMNLTEPQAGSDLGAVRTRAEPQTDGSYRIFGQKIFITYGEHDMAENIIHLVLARLPDAPAGTKGVSLFLVPKFLVEEDGGIGRRNDVRCVSIEHKLGIHASPTCVMSFGDNGGAIGYLVGEANRGLEHMFVMMNDARLVSGLQGVAVAERAYQRACAYARERVQGRDIGGGRESVPIIRHPDVRRMLLLMKSQTEAMRALAYTVAAAHDVAERHPDREVRADNQAFVGLLTPVVKGWSTETGIDVASIGIQVHGGVGYIEETGAAQHLRDVRIAAIYEGTTGIQANDLMGRKIAQDGGAAIGALIERMRVDVAELNRVCCGRCEALRTGLSAGIVAVEKCVAHILAHYGNDARATAVGAVPFLKLLGIVSGGWLMAKAAIVACRRIELGEGDIGYWSAKIASASFYADHVLSQASGLSHTVTRGAGKVMEMDEALF